MKNEVFILRQPKYSIISLVFINSELPLKLEQHDKIQDLNNFSDVLFIFPNTPSIDKNKFTSLYEGCGWIECGPNLCETYLKTILYSLEIFEKHVGYCLINIENIGKINIVKNIDKIRSITASTVTNPIFTIKRLSSQEFYDIYKKSNSGIFKTKEDTKNMYCSYTSSSNILYFKRSIAGMFVNFWKSSENNKYISSFSIQDPRYFFASLTKFLEIKTIDSDIESLDVGKLR